MIAVAVYEKIIDRYLDFIITAGPKIADEHNIHCTILFYHLALEDLLTSQEQNHYRMKITHTHIQTYIHTYKIYCTTLQSIIDYPQFYVY